MIRRADSLRRFADGRVLASGGMTRIQTLFYHASAAQFPPARAAARELRRGCVKY